MIRTRRADTDLTFAPRKVETLWVAPDAGGAQALPRGQRLRRRRGARRGGRAGPPALLHAGRAAEGDGLVVGGGARRRSRSSRKHPDGLDPRRLKQLAPRAAEVSDAPSKVRSLLRAIAALERREGIVFTQFRSTQDTIVDALRASGVEPAVFHGELGWREKEEALDRFRTALPVLVSTEAGGEGRNLQFCQHRRQLRPAVEPDAGRAADRPRPPPRPGRIRCASSTWSRAARSSRTCSRSSTEDPHVRAGGRRDGGDPRHLAAARLVRGRGLQALDRVDATRGCASAASPSWRSTSWSRAASTRSRRTGRAGCSRRPRKEEA